MANFDGLDRLSASLRGLAENKQRRTQRELLKFQQESSNLNATAQLIQAMGLYGGELEVNPEKINEISGGLISVKPKTKGLKKQEIDAKVSEGQAKREFSREMQDVKFGQELTLEQVKWANSMAKVEQIAKNGDEKAAFEALMDHVRSFGVTGGAEDVAKAQRAVQQAKDQPLTETQKPLQEEVGKSSGGVFGFGAKAVTREELVGLLESEQLASEAAENFKDIQDLISASPEDKKKWENRFFQEYPVLKGKLSFTDKE